MVIGVLGGMGTYATVHFFRQYAKFFPAEKEWDRPRMVIDNRCTMPSRVRAFLYNENTERLVSEMTDSMRRLADAGCDRIVLACNTSHLFLPRIFEKEPALRERVVNIIESCVDSIAASGTGEVYLLGTEGTIDSRVYQDSLDKRGIVCRCPGQEEYPLLRDCIEAVKQDNYTGDIREKFLGLVNRTDNCILGCTELPVLYEKYADGVTCGKVWDPLGLVLLKLKEEYDRE